MKKLLLFLLVAMMAYPCYANSQSQRRFTYFSGMKLTDVNSKIDAGKEGYQEGVDIYQFIPDNKNPAKTTYELTVSHENLNGDALSFGDYEQMSTKQKFEALFERDLSDHDDVDGTYRKMYKLNYKNETEGKLDAYVVKQYENKYEDGTVESLVFHVIRRVQVRDWEDPGNDNIVRVYTFTFEQKLEGNDISIRNRYNNVETFSPAGYFEHMMDNCADYWIEFINHLILPLFNK